MTDTEAAIICTIKQEPKYQFIYDEGRQAQKMEADGLLKNIVGKMFAVTKQGERAYAGTSVD